MDESILMNYLRGGCNDEECQQVELWCEEAPENRQILEQLYYTLFVGDRMAVMDAVDTEASLTKFKSLVREKEKKAKRRSISVRWGRYASAAAAFLAGLVFAGGIAWGLLSNKLSDYTGVPKDSKQLIIQKSNPLLSLSETGMSLFELKLLDLYLSRIGFNAA